MNSVDMSLDEIIARQRKTSKHSPRGRIQRNRNRRDHLAEYATADSAFTRADDVPAGRWDHSGFEEMYGNGSGPPVRAHRPIDRVDLVRKVCIHVTNLAPSVNTADLNDLLARYPIIAAHVNYDEMGESVGTADIVTDRATAREIIANLQGLALDGETMRFHMIDDHPAPIHRKTFVKDRLNYGGRPWGIMKKRLPAPKHSFGGNNNRRRNREDYQKRTHMTEEELDRELEEYMKKHDPKPGDEQMEA